MKLRKAQLLNHSSAILRYISVHVIEYR